MGGLYPILSIAEFILSTQLAEQSNGVIDVRDDSWYGTYSRTAFIAVNTFTTVAGGDYSRAAINLRKYGTHILCNRTA